MSYSSIDYDIISNNGYTDIIKLKLPAISDNEFPYISLVTPIYNRSEFVELLLNNFDNIDYPKEKIEWIIVDDSDKINIQLQTEIKQRQLDEKCIIRYIYLHEHITIGKKRNKLVSLCTHDIIVHMDDDDYYPSFSVATRVRTLLHYKNKGILLVGCDKVDCYDIISDTEFESYQKDCKLLSESTLAYYKSFYNINKYDDKDTHGEFINFAKNLDDKILTIPSSFIIVQLTHTKNTIKRQHVVGNIIKKFLNNLPMNTYNIIDKLKIHIISNMDGYKEILNIINGIKNNQQKINSFFMRYDDPINIPYNIREKKLKNRIIIEFRKLYYKNKFLEKNIKGKKIINYYCGPGSYFKFSNPWSPISDNIGGSEESVLKLSGCFSGFQHLIGHNNSYNDYIVIIYCVLDPVFEKKYYDLSKKLTIFQNIIFKQYWEWNPTIKSDITIIWRDPTIIRDITINSNKIILDMHDYFTWQEFNYLISPNNYSSSLNNFIIMTKSEYHTNELLGPNKYKYNKICYSVPNGIYMEPYNKYQIKKEKYSLISTSSPDRSLYFLIKLSKILFPVFPNVIIYWAYGFSSGISKGGLLEDKRPEVQEYLNDMQEYLKKCPNIINLGRLNQEQINSYYLRSNIFIYGTTFPEIDCISYSKAIAAGCIPIVTNYGALKEKNSKIQPIINNSIIKSIDDSKDTYIEIPQEEKNLNPSSRYALDKKYEIDKSLDYGQEFTDILNTLEHILNFEENKLEELRYQIKKHANNYDIKNIFKKWANII